MRKITLLFSALMLILSINAQNLLTNPSFESWVDGLPEGWKMDIDEGNGVLVTEESGIVSEGSKSIKIESPAGSKKTTIYQRVAITPGKTYELSISYYIVSGDGKDVRIWSEFKTGEDDTPKEEVGEELWNKLKGPDGQYFADERGEWKTYNLEFTPPASATHFDLEVRQYKGSVAYWDNMVLKEKSGATTPTLSVNNSTLSFNSTAVGTATAAQTVNVSASNLTSEPTYSVSGTDASMFSATGTLAVNGGAISVVFTPTSEDNKTATLTVSADGIDKVVNLTGTVSTSGGENPYGLDDSSPLTELNETFGDGTVSGKELPTGWTSFSEQGDRNWVLKKFDKEKNNYTQMSAYTGTETYQTLLISPAIDFDQIKKSDVSFDWKSAHTNGATLKVYVMSKDGSKTEIKSINDDSNPNGYGTFNTETLDLSTFSGVQFLVFEYNGDTSKTTTYQIDNVIAKMASGIAAIKLNSLKIWGKSTINFVANAGDKVEVYNVSGQKVISTLAEEGVNSIPCNKGVMIVKVGNRVGKIVL